MATDEIKYSEKIPGSTSNYHWPVRFDSSDGHIGITQFDDKDQEKVVDRVLLSPAQVRALVAFVKARGADNGSDRP
jgi:hypothetical protein